MSKIVLQLLITYSKNTELQLLITSVCKVVIFKSNTGLFNIAGVNMLD